MQAGEPFELIDGDNMYFPFRLLYYSLKYVLDLATSTAFYFTSIIIGCIFSFGNHTIGLLLLESDCWLLVPSGRRAAVNLHSSTLCLDAASPAAPHELLKYESYHLSSIILFFLFFDSLFLFSFIKGVYGTLMDSPIEEYDLLLILDPEGLNSDNADPQYERKVHELQFVTIKLLKKRTGGRGQD